MPLTITIKQEKYEEDEEMPMQRTPFQRKAARMFAKMAGRSKPNAEDMKKAADIEHEGEED